jgi:hypothetical protein
MLTLPLAKEAKVYVAQLGVEQQCGPGENSFVIPREQWLRLVGLDREEILRYARTEHR